DYVSLKPIHLDFQVVSPDQKVVVEVPLNLTGRAKGMKEGGILEEMIREIDVECLPENIPNVLEFDISDLELGEGFHIKDISLPEGVEALGNPDDMVASVQVPRAMVTETSAVIEEVEEDVEVEEGVEGEEGAEAADEESPKEESDSGDGEG
ncbi:MAG: 50S ribosomal protein L25, partial [Thermodesulfobacteriota bacterium]